MPVPVQDKTVLHISFLYLSAVFTLSEMRLMEIPEAVELRKYFGFPFVPITVQQV